MASGGVRIVRSFSSAATLRARLGISSKTIMQAVVIKGDQARLDRNRTIPKQLDDMLLVRPVSVALNPTDWRHIRGRRAKDGCIVGCDYAGIVESVGSAVTKKWKPGDRIFGVAHGANLVNPDDGAFAEVISVIGDLQMRMPDSLTFQQAATLGLGTGTVGQGLFQKSLKLRLPSAAASDVTRNDEPVLIYGGGSATGALGIQFAKEAGYTVITVCTPDHFDYTKSLGAHFVVDYKDPDAGRKIREYTNNKLRLAWNTISIPDSARICAEALTSSSSASLVYGSLLPTKNPRTDVTSIATVFHTTFGRAFNFGGQHMPASKDDYEFGKSFYGLAEQLIGQGRIQPLPGRVGGGGLKGVIDGLAELEAGKVQGEKLVYNVADTP
ncbi:zinc-binding oxidoreductase [Fusarium pseudocircinatum]|uniref:Zinc-binding oxidoreductase n=1 Tax=Fusarium pseudocircinatum TaxID=56676 RepID=A0A8H5PR68_9HYPO|nr:zinc-binding oxidoreductase [Fusarium pseudocircinatum]